MFWFLLLQSVVQYPQPVGDGLDKVMRQRMEAWAKLQEQEKIRLEREEEQLMLMQTGASSGDLLWSALQSWQVWTFAGLLVLLLAIWLMWRKRSCEAEIVVRKRRKRRRRKWRRKRKRYGHMI